jgi:hypothetical protein
MADWSERLRVGTAHERRVMRELVVRGWTVQPTGQGTYPAEIREALSRSESPLRQFPDLIAAQGSTIVAVDAKTNLSGASGRYAVSRKCLTSGLQFIGTNAPIPLFYVFGDLRVLTPAEIAGYSVSLTDGLTGAYVLISTAGAHTFDEVFGAAALRHVA